MVGSAVDVSAPLLAGTSPRRSPQTVPFQLRIPRYGPKSAAKPPLAVPSQRAQENEDPLA